MKLRISYIALADILANGVALVIILIIITLSIKQLDIKDDLEKIDAIGSVMSREIVDKLVLNSLPTSKPARLHDYNHPRNYSVPYFIMNERGVIVNSDGITQNINKLVTREQLLLQNNDLDQVLATMVKNKKNNIRMDILHIKHYYLIMSILKEYGIRVRDWHWLGTSGVNNNDSQHDEAYDSDYFEKFVTDGNNNEGSDDSDFLFTTEDFIIPVNDANNMITPNAQNNQGNSSEVDNAIEDLITRLGLTQGVSNQKFINDLQINFADGSSFNFQDMPVATGETTTNIPAAKIFLAWLFSYLESKQQQLNNNDFVEMTKKDFTNFRTADYDKYKDIIDYIYNKSADKIASTINYDIQHTADDILSVTINDNIKKLTIASQQLTKTSDDKKVSLKIYPHRTIEATFFLAINDEDLVIFPPTIAIDSAWLPIAIISKDISQVNLGLVKAQKINNNINIDTNINQVTLNNDRISSQTLNTKSPLWQYIVLIVIGLVLIIIVILSIK